MLKLCKELSPGKPISIGGFNVSPSKNSLKLNIPLTGSIAPLKGAQVTPTFNRDTTATVVDHEGIIHTALINEIRFPNARRVENLLSNTEVLSTQTVTVLSGSSYILSFSGTGSVTLSGAATGTLTGTTGRVQFIKTASTTSLTLTVSGAVLQAQLERLTGTQTEASEYVSTGVLSWPYHGAGVDGVKNFMTDRAGNALSVSGALIEPSTTNLFLNSSSPATQSITVVNGSYYTVWGTGSGSVVLSGAGSGTVTSLSPRTFTATSTTLTCTVTNMSTVQVELNVKTSYIQTSGTPVTRTADILSYDIGDIITQGQGSWYCEFKYSYSAGYPRIFELTDNTSNNTIIVRVTNTKYFGALVTTGGVNQTIITTSKTISNNTLYKVLLTYKNNSIKLYLNGVLVGEDLSCTVPNLLKLFAGCTSVGASQLNGYLNAFKYFKDVLSESEAIRRTS